MYVSAYILYGERQQVHLTHLVPCPQLVQTYTGNMGLATSLHAILSHHVESEQRNRQSVNILLQLKGLVGLVQHSKSCYSRSLSIVQINDVKISTR